MSELIQNLKTNPESRRHIISAWNVGEIPNMALPPCHTMFQFYVADGKLSCQLYQRSADLFLGVPFNIASYALLTMMIAQVVDLGLGDFVHTVGDAHIYHNHFEQVRLQLSRAERPLPIMKLNPMIKDLFRFQYKDFEKRMGTKRPEQLDPRNMVKRYLENPDISYATRWKLYQKEELN